MKEFREISLEMAQCASDNQRLKKEFAHLISDVKSFNGSIPGVNDLSFTIDNDVINIDFVGYKYQLQYRYKRQPGKSVGTLCLYQLIDDEERELKAEVEFDFQRKISGTRMAFDSETETMAIILNMIVSAIQS